MNNKLAFISGILLFACLIAACFLAPSFGDRSGGGVNARTDAEEQRLIHDRISQMQEEYRHQNDVLFAQFGRQLANAGDRGFGRARANIDAFADRVTGMYYCAKLCACLAKDKVSGGSSAMELLAPEISSYIVRPCLEGQAEILDALNNFLLCLQENDNQFRSGLSKLLDEENFTIEDLGLRGDFLKQVMVLEQRIQELALEKTLVAAGVGIEAVFIRSTCQAIARVLATVVGRLAGTAVVSGTCVAADGPLPVCDVIGATIAIGGFIWSGYDLYKIRCKLRPQLREHIAGMIDEQQREARRKALEHAGEVLQLCNRQDMELRSGAPAMAWNQK